MGSSTGGRRKKIHRIGSVTGAVWKTIVTIVLILIITACLLGGAFAFYVIKFVTPQNIDLSKSSLTGTTFIYATDTKTGQNIEEAQINGGHKRIWVPLSQMPKALANAVVSTEDKRFYEHEGVDWKRTASAFANLFLHFYQSEQGGSTITQQLVNNLTNAGKQKNYSRKVQEIVDALNIEKKYTKNQILECYLNTINLNEGCYGVEAASLEYFGKHVKDLDIAQCAILAGMPKAPATYDPYTHPQASKQRQQLVLKNMYQQGMISKDQYTAALNEQVVLANKTVNNTPKIQSWFTDMVIRSVENDLITKKGYTAKTALSMIYSGGLKIYSTMQPSVQSAMDSVYSDNAYNFDYWYKFSGDTQPQSGMTVVTYSGQIAGVEGGRGAKTGNMILDRATSSLRQPGSSIKPLAVYAPAIELNKITWATPISKSQIPNWKNGQAGPANDEPGYTGELSCVDALAQSVNTCAVHVEKDCLSPNYSFNFLKDKLGFTTLVDREVKDGKVNSNDKNLGIAIGALTKGVTTEEMAGAYEIFGNGGNYIKPYCYTKVLDGRGNVILENKPQASRAISSDTSFIMNELLQQDVTREGATGVRAALPYCPVGGKTGTTNEHKDRWFIGITPDYVGAVWYGYDIPKDIPGYLQITNPALNAWKNVMQIVQSKMPKKDFPTCGSVVQENYNSGTGAISPHGDETGWFKTSGMQ